MNDYQMGAIESRFADIIWENEPMLDNRNVALSRKVKNCLTGRNLPPTPF